MLKTVWDARIALKVQQMACTFPKMPFCPGVSLVSATDTGKYRTKHLVNSSIITETQLHRTLSNNNNDSPLTAM